MLVPSSETTRAPTSSENVDDALVGGYEYIVGRLASFERRGLAQTVAELRQLITGPMNTSTHQADVRRRVEQPRHRAASIVPGHFAGADVDNCR